MLAQYGNQVKKIDQDLEREKLKQLDSLEQRLKDRKQNRLREIEEQRRQSEKVLNDETVKMNSELTQEIK